MNYIRREKIVNYDFFDKIDTEEKAYWLGFILADGNIHKNKMNIQINLSALDEKHLEKFANIFKKDIYHFETYSKNYNKIYKIVTLSISSKNIHNSLQNVGVKINKTDNEDGSSVDFVKNDLLPHLVRGCFDGDGSISFKKRGNHLLGNFTIAGHPKLLKRFQKIIKNNTGLSEGEIALHHRYAVLRWGGIEQMKAIYDWLYRDSSIFLERKKEKFQKGVSTSGSRRGGSGYRGISWHKNNKKWLASISHNKKRLNLGYYENPEDAAIAYDKAVIQFRKPKYRLNFSEII